MFWGSSFVKCTREVLPSGVVPRQDLFSRPFSSQHSARARPSHLVTRARLRCSVCRVRREASSGALPSPRGLEKAKRPYPLPIAPIAARLCVLPNSPPTKFPHRRVGGLALGAGPAGALATLFDSAPPASVVAARCASSFKGMVILLEFFYPRGARPGSAGRSADRSAAVLWLSSHRGVAFPFS